MKYSSLILYTYLLSPLLSHAQSTELLELKSQLKALEKKIIELEKQSDKPVQEDKSDVVKIGGAIRTNYSYTSYDEDNKDRGGDFDFDLLRLSVSGKANKIGVNAEIRFFDYMTVIKHAYLSYDLSANWQSQLGITKVPFGNQPYNSHSWFFNSTYYLGLEDDHDMGLVLKRHLNDGWRLDLGFFKNDELGGVDGYVEDRSDRYSYDIVGLRSKEEGIYDEPAKKIGENNTFTFRYGYQWEHRGSKTEIGISALQGDLHDGQDSVGDYNAWAVHFNSDIGAWNIQLQHGQYDYDIEGSDQITVAAYAFYDSMAKNALFTTANVAYTFDIDGEIIKSIQLYNDFSLVYDKKDDSANTLMNVFGLLISAGSIYTYIDFVNARNQPFVGGSLVGDSDKTEQRLNINLGYYF